MENKALIVKKLEETINETRVGKVELEYACPGKVYSEEVQIRAMRDDGTIYYHGATNVSCDSGIALIRDVLRHEFFN